MMKLYASRGCGSVIVESVFAWLDLDYERREVGIFEDATDELRAVNPLAQVPTLVLDDGTILTETAAIVLWALEGAGERAATLAPPVGDPRRAEFLRWLIYFPAAIYPMYTIGDVPADWVGDEAAPRLKRTTVERTLSCWRVLEQNLLGPGHFALGDDLSVLDIYAAVMSHWRPGRERIREVAPRLMACADRTESHPTLAPLFAREFPA